MPTAKRRATPPKAVDLERMTQTAAAWLVGKTASWLRDNGAVAGRNSDGSYNGRELVAAIRRDYAPAELPDRELEACQQVADEVAGGLHDSAQLGGLIELLGRIEADHGAAGLAAIGSVMLERSRVVLAALGDPATEPELSEVEIEDTVRRRVANEVAVANRRRAQRSWRLVAECGECNAYRWGREWMNPPLPEGYAATECPDLCPTCVERQKKQSRRRSS